MRTLRILALLIYVAIAGVQYAYRRIRHGKLEKPDFPVIISEAGAEAHEELAREQRSKSVDDAFRDGELAVLYQDRPSRWC